MPRWGRALAGLALALPAALSAQTADTADVRQLAPGVEYRRFSDAAGPWVVSLVRVDLRRPELTLEALRAHDQFRGREKTSDMVRRATAAGTQVLAAVNADFFELKSGENENNQVIAGEWWKGEKVTDSPYDSFDNVHSQFALDSAGRPSIDRFLLDGRAWTRDAVMPILTLNVEPAGALEGTTLFTARFGAATPRDTATTTVEATLVAAGRRGDTLRFVRRGPVIDGSGSPIPPRGAVLAAHGPRAKELRRFADGDTVSILLTTLPRPPHDAAPRLIVGGWPRILRDGENVAGEAATVEGTLSTNAEARHPRTAVGFSRDSSTLYLVAVDGRSTVSVGTTLVELADLMRRVGAWQAMNFDGGGSTTMVVDGAVVNVPTDAAGERAVGSALAVVRRR